MRADEEEVFMSEFLTAAPPVRYSITGSGPGLLFLHGTGGTAEACWGHLARQFADDRTIMMVDYSGTGQEVDKNEPLTLEFLAAQVAAVIRSTADGPVDVVGLSLGAEIAAVAAAEYPDLVRRSVLIGGWFSADDSRQIFSFDFWRRLLRSDSELFSRFLFLAGLSPGCLGSFSTQHLEEMVAGSSLAPDTDRQIALDMRADLSSWAPLVKSPTLVVGLTRDHMVPVEHSRELHAAIPGSEYAEIDSGHVVVYERPDELADVLLKFLTKE
ncbi:alpha/beta fold hydrolase [Streptomyces sp. NPDC059761]|uniref:alpha/beta fold hydrolase n=1 Tax=Streptomyces sp. NPDC059761 TaxID=3346937 RepID=UPI00364A3206